MIYSKNLKQLRRYRAALGEEMVVYKLGYEQDLFDIDEVSYYREPRYQKMSSSFTEYAL